MTPRNAERLIVAGPAGDIEVVVDAPAATRCAASRCVPSASAAGRNARQQGRAHACKTFYAMGYVAMRFNFRGVGRVGGLVRRRYRRDRGRARGARACALRASAKRCPSRSRDSRSARSCRRASRSRSKPERTRARRPRRQPLRRRARARRTRSSSTARRTTSFRSPTCSRGRVRRSCPSSCFRAAGTSSTAACCSSQRVVTALWPRAANA